MQPFFLWMLSNGSYFLLISVGIALVRLRYLTGYLGFVGLFVGLAAVGELFSFLTARVLHIPNLYILHTYTILEFNVIALFYHHFFARFYPRWLVPGLMAGFTVLAVLNSIFLQDLTHSNTYARSLESLLVIALALLCYYKVLTELPAKRLNHYPVFWINTGLLLYFASNIFFFMLSNALLKQPKQVSFMAWGLHALLMALMHLFIGIGLWFSPRPR
ncbi:hypothetical protein [Hymenobacter negativus]|uniref:Uncharacterized protein n=1 Tax=Hymenobacter negativus TaxID=2795026 RepID=A0ABS3QJG7_9BACT|nr:hypothetical protein [Hymenobacter negativus]MBO2011382.1 hypothetical protein [Hymenobacter negativus]